MQSTELLGWLLGEWPTFEKPICVLEGFSGIGKTNAAHRVRRAWSGPSVLASAAESDDLENLLFYIASKLEDDGCSVVADYAGGDFRQGTLELLRNPSLIIIDDFESLLSPETRLPRSQAIAEYIRDIGRLGGDGRLLLVTSESPAEGQWLEAAVAKTMSPPRPEDAASMLHKLLDDRGLSNEIPPDKFDGVVAWLGSNPRAMEAFVACLLDEPFEELIGLDVESWDVRDVAVSPELVARLEAKFLRKTINRLDAPTHLLLQLLSVFRRTFTIDAIREFAPRGSSAEALRTSLTSRFLVNRDRRWYSLNPVARQISLNLLADNQRKAVAAHSLAAAHYAKRLPTPTRVSSPGNASLRSQVRSGMDFVEARYHLLKAGNESEFQDLAANYRAILLKNYKDIREVPTDARSAAELLATLAAALHDTQDGYSNLRGVLAELLRRRGRPADLRLAYYHATVATRHPCELGTWLLRLELALELDTVAAAVAVIDQGSRSLRPDLLPRFISRSAEWLARKGEYRPALKAVQDGISLLKPSDRQPLYSLGAYVLCQLRDVRGAIELLTEGYSAMGPEARHSWRLFEQAVFLSFSLQDRDTIRNIRDLIVREGLNEHQPVLCEVLDYQLRGNYRQAAELAGRHVEYFAVVAQGAFCWLVEGEVEKAASLFEQGRFVSNAATWWLRGLIALCQGSIQVYCDAFGRVLGRALSEDERRDPALWIRTWADAPGWIGVYPAFYFPVLPVDLTGLTEDVVAKADDLLIDVEYPLHEISLPVSRYVAGGMEGVSAELAVKPLRELVVNLFNYAGEELVLGDQYIVGSGVGIGRNVRIRNASGGRDAVWPGGIQRDALVDDLRSLLEYVESEKAAASDEQITLVRNAVVASEQEDPEAVHQYLRRAGSWAIDRANEIGAAIAASAIQAAMGIG